MELHTYIYRLLFEYDCIIVPNFGAFVCTYKKMEFNPQLGFINPARKLVSFNQNLTANDGLLANYIAGEEKIDSPASFQKIADWVSHTNHRMQQGQTISLKGIGSFCLDDEKNLVFVPEITANFLPETYGLQKLKLPEKAAKIQPVEENTEIATPSSKNIDPLAKVITLPTIQPTTKKETRKRLKKHPVPQPVASLPPPREKKKGSIVSRRVTYFFVLTLLMACLFFLQDFMYHSKLSFGSLWPTRVSHTKPHQNTNTIQPAPKTLSADSLQNTTNAQPSVETLPSPNSQSDTIYYIIVGAFGTEKNASDLVSELEATGKTFNIIKTANSPLYRVGVGQFNTRFEALIRLDATRAELKKPGAWVLAVKK